MGFHLSESIYSDPISDIVVMLISAKSFAQMGVTGIE